MKSFIGVLVLVLSVAPLRTLAAGNAQAGQAIFNRTCKACHGADGQGNPVMAKMLKATLPILSSKDIQAKSDDEIKKTILDGKNKMRPVKTIQPNEIPDVIAYVRSLKK